MTKRVISDIIWLVLSPSYYWAEAWPTIRITFDGRQWQLTDGRIVEFHPTLISAAERVSLVANRVLVHMTRASNQHPGPQ